MNMPKMPGLPSSSDSSPFTDGAENSAPEVELNLPDHSEKKPSIVTDGNNDATQKSVIQVISKQGIEVVALRKGFYNQIRRREGDRFSIKSFDDIGEWMRCVDSALEKKRLQFYKDKKAKK